MGLEKPSVRPVTGQREGGREEEELGLFPWPRPPWHCLSHSSYFSIDGYFEYVPSKGRRALLWLALDGDGTVYCTGAKQQQKKKMKKKKTQKRKKKSQFGDGTICSLEAPDPFRSIVSFNCV